MRVQDYVLLTTAVAWDLECPSKFPRLHNNNLGAEHMAGTVTVASPASRNLILECPSRWGGPVHIAGPNQAGCRS
jgi:hypothetical protein